MIQQTEQDLAAENAFRVDIEAKFKCLCVRVPMSGRLDYAAIRQYVGEKCFYVAAWLELKCRNVEAGKYPTIFIPKDKLELGLSLMRHFGNYKTKEDIPLFYMIRFTDADYYAKIIQIDPRWNQKAVTLEGQKPSEVYEIPFGEFKQF